MIKTDITVPIKYTVSEIKAEMAKRLRISCAEIKEVQIVKRTLLLSNKEGFKYKMTVAAEFSSEREAGFLKMRKTVFPYEYEEYTPPVSKIPTRPIVVGSGPAGLFAALVLAEGGAFPIVIERGLPLSERRAKVQMFSRLGVLDTECNVQFGEGGAGTYSDGKLKVGARDKYKNKVLREFVLAGAEEDIFYSSTAHLGTDCLSEMVGKIRDKIIALGGEFIFSAKLTELKFKSNRIVSAVFLKDGKTFETETENLILATGHSAKDVYELLKAKGVPMSAKGFGVGMRIEHPREYINKLVYGEGYPDSLESASYHLVTHLPNGRSVYSFCMCPGGTVVAASSDEGAVVTNGMSEYMRDKENSNAAFLVSVTPEDFPSNDVLSGIELQKKIEAAAYLAAGGCYRAPAVRMSEFLSGGVPKDFGCVSPSYPIGVSPVSPKEYLPGYITESLSAAIHDFNEWMPGFLFADAIMTGAETRSTSPVRIQRNADSYMVEGFEGLYPAGEGAGYAGGIVSSAVDGIRCADALMRKYSLS